MPEATVLQVIETNVPGVEVVLLEASDGETYNSRKLSGIEAAHLSVNRDNAAADASGVTFTRGEQVATIELINSVTDLRCTLTLYGK